MRPPTNIRPDFTFFSIVSPSRWLIPSAKRHERQSGRRRDDSRGEKQSTPHRISSESSKVTHPRLVQSFLPFCSLSSANFVFSTSNLRLPYVFTSISPFLSLIIFIRIRRSWTIIYNNYTRRNLDQFSSFNVEWYRRFSFFLVVIVDDISLDIRREIGIKNNLYLDSLSSEN